MLAPLGGRGPGAPMSRYGSWCYSSWQCWPDVGIVVLRDRLILLDMLGHHTCEALLQPLESLATNRILGHRVPDALTACVGMIQARLVHAIGLDVLTLRTRVRVPILFQVLLGDLQVSHPDLRRCSWLRMSFGIFSRSSGNFEFTGFS